MIQKFKIQTAKSARYFQIGELSSMTKNIWIVLHGYGMLPEYFIKKFECIANKETVIVAPEALNKFYLKDNYSRVGSSWMTKVERYDDIQDNINFLNSIYASLKLEQIDFKFVSSFRPSIFMFGDRSFKIHHLGAGVAPRSHLEFYISAGSSILCTLSRLVMLQITRIP